MRNGKPVKTPPIRYFMLMRIRHLPETLVNQIAAGEVIERPAAAVKELVENSIDAGATMISVDLRQGGKSLIVVSDNGHGMGREDLIAALDRHATSKLPGDDLLNIHTMGFRGEALPSIGAVARVSIKTREKDGEAWEIGVEGGKKEDAVPCGHPIGTQIAVRDLFYATPARLKFLKSERAEFMAVKDAVTRLAMAFPAIGFKLTHDGRDSLNLPQGQDAQARLSILLGREFGENALPVRAERDAMTLAGFAGLPTAGRGTAQYQYLFVNGRPVRDKLLNGALRAAYADVLARDLRNLAALRGAPLSKLPEISVLRIDQAGQPPRYFTLLRNTGHRNVSQLLTENGALAPAENTLTVAVGLVGSYPNALYRVDRERLGTFTQQLSQLRTAMDYRVFAERYAIRRTHPQFWAFSDALQQAHQAQDAVRDAGLLDYNRWENR